MPSVSRALSQRKATPWQPPFRRPSPTRRRRKSYPIYVAGEWQTSQEPLAVRNPFSGEVIGVTYQASRDQLEQAIVGAERAFEITRTSPTYERVAQLEGDGRRSQRASRRSRADDRRRSWQTDPRRGGRNRSRRLHPRDRRRGSKADRRRGHSARPAAELEGPHWRRAAIPHRPDRRHLAVQLSRSTSLSTRSLRRLPPATRSCSSHRLAIR